MSDAITVLRARARRLAKLIRTDGTIVGYDSAKTFDMTEVSITDLDHLGRLLRRLLDRPDCCIVRGAIAAPDRTRRVRRLYHPDAETGEAPTIRDTTHRWIGLDVEGVVRPDDIDAADLTASAQLAIALLPGEFQGVRCIVQASAGHGLKPGCRLRLWFWASRPVTGGELSYWMRRSPVDSCLFRPAQVTYTAAPVFQSGQDHLPNRMLALDGAAVVGAPPAEALCPPAPAAPSPSIRRATNTPVERLIARSLLRVETAGEGERHSRLRAAARTIGGVLDQAGISETEAKRVLLDAVKRSGGNAVNETNASQTIAWALARGRQAPLQFGVTDAR
ncbi:MAG TPA: hypothetical protein VGC09_02890 [Rhodopila sp.]